MKTSASLLSPYLPTPGVRAALFLIAAITAVSASAHAQTIFVADPNGTNGVRSYNIDGTLINNSLIGGSGFQGLALVGSTLYVARTSQNTVGAYTLDGTGAVTSSSTIITGGGMTGLTTPYGLSATATNVFVADYNNGNVFKYNLSGTQLGNVNGVLNNPYGLAVYGDNLFVSTTTTSGANTIKRYTISTYSNTPTLTITSGLNHPAGLAISGDTLYVANSTGGTITTYHAGTGASIATLVSGLSGPQGITVYESSLFVTGSDGTVKGFDALTGNPLAGFPTITGLSSPYGIVVGSMSAIPEPSTYAAIAGAAMLGLAVWQRRRKLSPTAIPV